LVSGSSGTLTCATTALVLVWKNKPVAGFPYKPWGNVQWLRSWPLQCANSHTLREIFLTGIMTSGTVIIAPCALVFGIDLHDGRDHSSGTLHFSPLPEQIPCGMEL